MRKTVAMNLGSENHNVVKYETKGITINEIVMSKKSHIPIIIICPLDY